MTRVQHRATGRPLFHSLFFLVAVFCTSPGIAAGDANPEIDPHIEEGWNLVRDRGGIKVYFKHNDDSKLKTFRGTRTFELADSSAIMSALLDIDRLGYWVHFIRKVEELGKESRYHRYYRVETGLPWPVKDRETLVEARFSQDPATHAISLRMGSKNDLLPPNDNFIRIPSSSAHLEFTFLEDGRIEALYEAQVDPGGYIPPFLANMILSDACAFTLKKLPKMMQKEEYQGHRDRYPEFSFPEVAM